MTQNVYDDREFFEGYSQLRRSTEGLDGAPEWPAMQRMLPAIQGLNIIDLGCGFGWFSHWANEQGAAQVLGIDVSEKMLDRARAINAGVGISYERADLERLELPERSFDLAYSSLAFHYVEDAAQLYDKIHHALVPGGHLVFSTEHPIYMAPRTPGWSIDADGKRKWPIDSYFLEGPRTTNWLASGVIKHYRTIGSTLNLLIRCGFKINHVEEFCPTAEQIHARPELAEEVDRPIFLLVAAQR
jgi:SAM-dependent methyltransferase